MAEEIWKNINAKYADKEWKTVRAVKIQDIKERALKNMEFFKDKIESINKELDRFNDKEDIVYNNLNRMLENIGWYYANLLLLGKTICLEILLENNGEKDYIRNERELLSKEIQNYKWNLKTYSCYMKTYIMHTRRMRSLKVIGMDYLSKGYYSLNKDKDNSPKKIAACQYIDQRIKALETNDVELISENLKIQEKLMFGRVEIIKIGDELYYKSRLQTIE